MRCNFFTNVRCGRNLPEVPLRATLAVCDGGNHGAAAIGAEVGGLVA